MTPQAHIPDQQHPLVDAIVSNVLQPNNHDLLRHLGQVLGIGPSSKVLLIVEADAAAQAALKAALDSPAEVFHGNLRQLPYETAYFDSAIVAVPISAHLHTVAGELSRVLKPNGGLGMVVFSVYRDQMPEDTMLFAQVTPLIATTRPAAAYRAVLAECGFTAFVSEDRRREVRRAARDNYRHLLNRNEQHTEPQDSAAQALGLMATGGIGLTLITAEKSL
jgi:ubiquinone/menaquinone biosynthesis C-methylase UbiE